MGRHGPAFLAYPNFQAFLGWNSAEVYSTTVAYFATRLAGAPNVDHEGAKNVRSLTTQQIMELQRILNKLGYDVGEVDGKVGYGTRAAVKKAQIKFGLPADSYPTAELIERLRGSGNNGAQQSRSTFRQIEYRAAALLAAHPQFIARRSPMNAGRAASLDVHIRSQTARSGPSSDGNARPAP